MGGGGAASSPIGAGELWRGKIDGRKIGLSRPFHSGLGVLVIVLRRKVLTSLR